MFLTQKIIMKQKILHLTLKKKWFDLIISGKKKVENREVKPYWTKRFKKQYDVIKFVNGYGKDKPFMIIEYLGINTKGMKLNPPKYNLMLGKILETGNIREVKSTIPSEGKPLGISAVVL